MKVVAKNALPLRVVCAPLVALCLTACQQSAVPKPKPGEPFKVGDFTVVEKPALEREEEFRWKERCAIAAERLDKLFEPRAGSPVGNDTSVSEVFYSAARNSCVCEVSAVGKGGKTGLRTLLTLHDCLTRENLGETLIEVGGQSSSQLMEDWDRKKNTLKASPAARYYDTNGNPIKPEVSQPSK